MAGRADIEAGRAFVRLFLKDGLTGPLTRVLKSTSTQVSQAGRAITGVGANLAKAGAAMALPFVASIKAASDFQEDMAKFNVVFGDRSDEVKQWGDDFAAVVQRAEGDVAKFLAANQDLFIPLGFDPGSAENLSKQVAGLTFDLASFNNMADASVQRDLQAALTGSGEVMKKYGVVLSEAAVKQELLNMGMDPKTAENQTKVQARLNIIMRGTTAAQGDAARTAGGFANQMKGLQGKIKDTAVEIGSALLPHVTKFAEWASKSIVIAKGWIKQNKGLVVALAAVSAGLIATGAALVGIGGAMIAVGAALSGMAAVITTVAGAIGLLFTPLGAVAGLLVGGIALWARYTSAGQSAVKGLTGLLDEYLSIGKRAIGGIRDALANGDLSLAGEIAIAGLQSAMARGLDKLSSAIGGQFGGFIKNLGVLLIRGDLGGAWSTVTDGMARTWAIFNDSMLRMYGVSIDGIIDGASGVIRSVMEIFNVVADYASVMSNSWSATWSIFVASARVAILEVRDNLAHTFGTYLPGLVRAAFDAHLGYIATFIVSVMGDWRAHVTRFAKHAISELSEIPRRLAESFNVIMTELGARVASIAKAVKHALSLKLNDTSGIDEVIRTLRAANKTFASDVGKGLAGVQMRSAVRSMPSTLDLGKGVVDDLATASKDAATTFTKIVRSEIARISEVPVSVDLKAAREQLIVEINAAFAARDKSREEGHSSATVTSTTISEFKDRFNSLLVEAEEKRELIAREVAEKGGTAKEGTTPFSPAKPSSGGFAATFSAAAAVGASMLGGGHPDATDPGRQNRIEQLRTQKELLAAQREQARLDRIANQNMERFLAGMLVR